MKRDEDFPLLSPGTERFPNPEMLKRSGMAGLDATMQEELQIAAAEGDAAGDAGEFARLRLTPDQTVRFDGKDALKRRPTLPRPALLWAGAAAAVAITLLLILPRHSEEKHTPLAVVAIEKDTISTPLPEITPKMEQAHPAPAQPARTGKAVPIVAEPAPAATEPERSVQPFPESLAPQQRLIAEQESIGADITIPQPAAVAANKENAAAATLLALVQGEVTIQEIAPVRKGFSKLISTILDKKDQGMEALARSFERQVTEISRYDSEGNLVYYARQTSRPERKN